MLLIVLLPRSLAGATYMKLLQFSPGKENMKEVIKTNLYLICLCFWAAKYHNSCIAITMSTYPALHITHLKMQKLSLTSYQLFNVVCGGEQTVVLRHSVL